MAVMHDTGTLLPRDKAIGVARNVKGVTKVENGLQIQPPETKK